MMNKHFLIETSIGRIWVDLENKKISPIAGSGIYKAFDELSDALLKEIEGIAMTRKNS